MTLRPDLVGRGSRTAQRFCEAISLIWKGATLGRETCGAAV
jgi:hypothetical protein